MQSVDVIHPGRHCIKGFQKNDTSPLTNKELDSKNLIPNHNLKSAIEQYNTTAAMAARSGSGGRGKGRAASTVTKAAATGSGGASSSNGGGGGGSSDGRSGSGSSNNGDGKRKRSDAGPAIETGKRKALASSGGCFKENDLIVIEWREKSHDDPANLYTYTFYDAGVVRHHPTGISLTRVPGLLRAQPISGPLSNR